MLWWIFLFLVQLFEDKEVGMYSKLDFFYCKFATNNFYILFHLFFNNYVIKL